MLEKYYLYNNLPNGILLHTTSIFRVEHRARPKTAGNNSFKPSPGTRLAHPALTYNLQHQDLSHHGTRSSKSTPQTSPQQPVQYVIEHYHKATWRAGKRGRKTKATKRISRTPRPLPSPPAPPAAKPDPDQWGQDHTSFATPVRNYLKRKRSRAQPRCRPREDREK